MSEARIPSPHTIMLYGTWALLSLVAVSAMASAHEHVTSGDLEFVIGWGTEPPVVGVQNTVAISVRHHLANNSTELVSGVAQNMTVTISTGPASAFKAVEDSFGSPGWYEFAIIPTREGVYSIRITGTIEGTMFNVSAELEEVAPAGDISFPVVEPTPDELQDNASEQQALIAALQAQIANFTNAGSSAQIDQLKKDNAALKADLGTAMFVGALGAVFGLVGTGIGVVGMRKGRGDT
jgi:hypothetical protein